MIRTQIQLTDEQERRLRHAARREGVSIAEIVRRCIDQVLTAQLTERADAYRRAARLVGRFQGPRDLSGHHDDALEETYE